MKKRNTKYGDPVPLTSGDLFYQKFNFIRTIARNIILPGLILFSAGCSSHDHLKFQGIPITGDLIKFTEMLKEKGYIEVKADGDDQMKFKGRFLERDCNVYLSMTKKSRTPYLVRVDMAKEPHDSVKYSYERLKQHCESILGTGASKYQQFNNSSRFLFNEPKLVRDPQDGDYTRYLSRIGSVYLEVKLDYLSITYLDKKNCQLSVAEGGKEINPESDRGF